MRAGEGVGEGCGVGWDSQGENCHMPGAEQGLRPGKC